MDQTNEHSATLCPVHGWLVETECILHSLHGARSNGGVRCRLRGGAARRGGPPGPPRRAAPPRRRQRTPPLLRAPCSECSMHSVSTNHPWTGHKVAECSFV